MNSDKSFEEKYNDLGAFEYHDDGFTIAFDGFVKTLKWNEITEMNAYKADMFTTDRIEVEIVYGDKAFSISEDLPGWYQFVEKIKNIFDTIPKDWDTKIVQPAFATNWTNIYKSD